MKYFHLRFRYIFLFIFSDFTAVFFSVILAYKTYFLFPIDIKPHPFFLYRNLAQFTGVLLLIFFYANGLYKYKPSPLNINEFERIIKAVTIGFAFLLTGSFFLNIKIISRMILFISIFYSIILTSFFRYLILKMEQYFNLKTTRTLNVLIYGANQTGIELYNNLIKTPRITFNILGFLDDQHPKGSLIKSSSLNYPHKTSIIGTLADLSEIAHRNKIDVVFIALDENKEDTDKIFQTIQKYVKSVFYVPLIYRISGQIMEVTNIGEIPLVGISPVFYPLYYRILKRTIDITLSLLLLILLSPVLIFISLSIFISDGAPIIFKQKRIGINKRPFTIYKFRTMKKTSPAYAPTPTSSSDDRILPIGKFYRKTGLDELPQLWNVLKGEMSIIGPRPEMPFIVETREEKHYNYRFLVKPGITGLWQISKDRYLEIHENIEYDLYYVRHANLFLDIAILILTVFSFNKGV